MEIPLFAQGDLAGLLDRKLEALRERIYSLGPDALADPRLEDDLIHEFLVDPPKLRRADIWAPEARDVRVDVRHDRMRAVFDRSQPALVPGTRIEFHVPFDGDAGFFNYAPNLYGPVQPRGQIVHGELVVAREAPSDSMDAHRLKTELERDIDQVERYLLIVQERCESYNESIRRAVGQLIERRRAKLAADRTVEQALGVPVRKRTDPESSLQVDVPRKRRPVPLKADGRPKERNAAISEADFGALVEAIDAFGRSVERFPNTFAPMEEEVLRELLLVVLNNQFGPAVGEMFSRQGKTDIAVLHEKGPVFIAECKFYDGPRSVDEALDQLLGYLVWRDTKAALVLFVKRQDVTKSLQRAHAAIEEHVRFRRLGERLADHSRFLLAHEGDEGRLVELILIGIPVPVATDR